MKSRSPSKETPANMGVSTTSEASKAELKRTLFGLKPSGLLGNDLLLL